ncbi:MAG: tRNA lysidine(34) synthetase TilS [Bdellovibrionaceae bacterium]|nr:tRNA lysidine(34) synthetase TilS [Pseudobdellovibrionaceae bacterium]
MNLSAFEHHFIRTFKSHFGDHRVLGERRFLVAVSGGADSVACAQLFSQFQPRFQYEWRIAHVHHGLTDDSHLQDFRQQSVQLVGDLSEMWGVEFLTNSLQEAPLSLRTEEQLRNFRYECFKNWQSEGEILVLGHHLEDQLESQIMDLLRGSHFQSWDRFKVYHQGLFRPLSLCDKKDIVAHLEQKQIPYLEDPSNQDVTITRNWIRHELLLALEGRFPGAKLSLSQNLKKLYDFEALGEPLEVVDVPTEILLSEWLLFTYSQKQKFVLNSYLRLAHKSLTQGQIEEVIKQLDQRQKEHRFQTGPIFWTKNAEKITARRENL